jgi:hypothetical protein
LWSHHVIEKRTREDVFRAYISFKCVFCQCTVETLNPNLWSMMVCLFCEQRLFDTFNVQNGSVPIMVVIWQLSLLGEEIKYVTWDLNFSTWEAPLTI